MFRVENLNDNVDATPETVDIKALVEELWNDVNGDEQYNYDLTETSVTGNMPISEMEARRLKWKTNMDYQELSNSSIGDTGKSITLESMRIRVFVVDYNPKS
jgi:hypothetical protein